MRKARKLVALFSLLCLFQNTNASIFKNKDVILKIGIATNYNFKAPRNLPKEISIKQIGQSSSFQFGINSQKTELSETRHYIELNQLFYAADIYKLGTYNSNKLYLGISPFQQYVRLNPNGEYGVYLEAGVTFGINLLSIYNYNFAGEERKKVIKSERANYFSMNFGFNVERLSFNKNAEVGIKWKVSPNLGSFSSQIGFIATEVFYGIRF